MALERCEYELVTEKYFGLPAEIKENDKIVVDFGSLCDFAQTVKNTIKTRQGWEDSGLDLDKYLKYPCEVDEHLIDYVRDCRVPAYLNKGLLQGGDCEYQEDSMKGNFKKVDFYMTFNQIENRYFYLGILPKFKS